MWSADGKFGRMLAVISSDRGREQALSLMTMAGLHHWPSSNTGNGRTKLGFRSQQTGNNRRETAPLPVNDRNVETSMGGQRRLPHIAKYDCPLDITDPCASRSHQLQPHLAPDQRCCTLQAGQSHVAF